ncbi:phosphoribosylanthranilate isomerase [Ascidiaceihabitans sp.]|uniref:phosphoribosylanthranilate isomerase n=1 Tax=Ascidiaceihabitans sp. TaxID=1872644 RepID=UPI003299EDC5
MSNQIAVKICGVTRPADVDAVAAAGARYLGFNFFPKSPRFVSFETARDLSVDTPVGVAKVGLVVNADDAMLQDLTDKVPLDFLQLHGSETPERVAEIRSRFGLPIIKVVGVANASDVNRIDSYEAVADQILVDAKAPKDAVLPGGNGLAFDWGLLAARKYWRKPWMLAGGLTPDNVRQAVLRTGARQVDVASGVESTPGVKDADTIHDFVKQAQIP